MSVPYNPFELFDLPTLKDMLRKGRNFLVIQRFSWPGIPAGKGFMVSAYQDEKTARQHAEKLDGKEGRLVNVPVEYDTVTLLINHPQYLLFISAFREPDWQARLLGHYQKNIEMFMLASMEDLVSKETGIELHFQYGTLKAVIRTRNRETEVDVIDLIFSQLNP
jgi:hypothetical protein